MSEEQIVPASAIHPGVAASVPTASAQAPSIDVQRLLASPEAARTLAEVGPGYDATRFEERLALLERTLSTTLNALSQIIGHAQQPAGEEGKEASTK